MNEGPETLPAKAPAPRTAAQAPIRVVVKHHALVRLSHWLNIPLLLGMIVSGLSIYWASPVYGHPRALASWIYEHVGVGTGSLAAALRLHWLFAYLFMANGVLYLVGLAAGRGWKALLPGLSDVKESFAMARYYLGAIPMKLRKRPWPHPVITRKYNALQRGAYFSVFLAGCLSVLSGWVMHKPAQLGLLERLFGSYDGARVWHFWLMLFYVAFVLPHVVMVAADGWDTFRAMVTGWSRRPPVETHHG
jgi:thiosulfate reductase cytochrome b subunit